MMNCTSRNPVRGFTLIEILVSLFILAMMTAVAIPTMNNIGNVYQKTATQRLGGNIKYLFDRSILERLYIRLVIDFESNTYWSESTRDPFFLRQKPLDVENGLVVVEEEEDEEDELFANDNILFQDSSDFKWQGWADFAEKFKKKKPAFTKYKTELTNKTELPTEVQFYKVDTKGVDEPVTEGQIFIHFFPNGYVEKSVIWLAKTSELEDEEMLESDLGIYSILINPLSGRSLIVDYGLELPEDMEDEESDF